MVAAVTSGSHIGVVSMTALRYAQADAGEVVIPVRPSQVVHANFKHIQALPEWRQQDGVPLYKLRILDALIDQFSPKGRTSPLDSESIDLTIGEMSRALRAHEMTPSTSSHGMTPSMASRGMAEAYRAGFLPAAGAFVNLLA
jgi:hypothetical protein